MYIILLQCSYVAQLCTPVYLLSEDMISTAALISEGRSVCIWSGEVISTSFVTISSTSGMISMAVRVFKDEVRLLI